MTTWTSTRESGAVGESWTSDEFPGYVIRHSDGMPYYDIDLPKQHAPARRSRFDQAEYLVRANHSYDEELRRNVAWGPTAQRKPRHDFVAPLTGNQRWCVAEDCGYAEDAFVHASDEERDRFLRVQLNLI